MNTPHIAVQYLENMYADVSPDRARQRLRETHDRLPFDLVILGWNASSAVEEAVAAEATRLGTRLFRWQPLLSGEAGLEIPSEWQVVGIDGKPVSGYRDLPEFTFFCPNHPALAEFTEERLANALKGGHYQGIFLDRIRFPSPAGDPSRQLACFCRHCSSQAADQGFDLAALQRYLSFGFSGNRLAPTLVASLLGEPPAGDTQISEWLDFRCQSITKLVTRAAKYASSRGMEAGLDCFTPLLARMVGQDLRSLQKTAGWIKIMTYPRVFAPAGLPFELGGLATWLVENGSSEEETRAILQGSVGKHLPFAMGSLNRLGLDASVIRTEIETARKLEVASLLAGIALVQFKGIHEISSEQVRADILAARYADGVVVSWDIWMTDPQHLDIARKLLCEEAYP